jgi:prophage tail gpP-like protein
VVEKLVEPWGIEVDWNATDIQLDKVRFRDGCRVIDELSRVCRENCYFMWETRDGKLYVTDAVGRTTGEPLVLGVNILQFSAEQGEDTSKKKFKAKGKRTKKGIRGEEAVLNTYKDAEDDWVESEIPTTVQTYGDATPDSLDRRIRFEADKRSASAKKLTIEVFHVQSTGGEPWDVGQIHYVEVPPEAIFDEFECTEITYSVKANAELKTTMVLSPPPTAATKVSGDPTGNLPEVKEGKGGSRKAAKQVTTKGGYPKTWSGSVLSFSKALLAPTKLVPIPFSGARPDGTVKEPRAKPPLKLRNK